MAIESISVFNVGSCKKVQHLKCIDDKNYDSQPIYFSPISEKLRFCCSLCIDNFELKDFAILNYPVKISDETKSLNDLCDSDTYVSNIESIINELLSDLLNITTLFNLEVEKWANKTLLELIDSIEDISTKLTFDVLLIKGKYMLVLKSLEMQKYMFQKVEGLMFKLKEDLVDLEKTYLELNNALLSLCET